MKRALIIGLSGYNLGDEAIAVATYLELRKKYQTVSATTVKSGTLGKYGIPEIVFNRRSIRSWFQICKEMASSDTVYIGGGSLIQDKLGIGLISGVLSFFLQSVIASKLLSKRVTTLPIGADQLNTKLGKAYAKTAIALLGKLNLRDQASENVIKSISPNKSTQVYADPAYLLPSPTAIATQKKVLISLVLENLDEEKLRQIHSGITEAFNQNQSDLFYIAMERRESDELSLYQSLGIPADRIIIPSDINEAIMEIRNSRLLIAMRLHALILGHGHVPLIGISRTTKTAAFCMEGNVPILDIENIPENVSDALIKMNELTDKKFKDQQDASAKKNQLARNFFNDN
ncbi:hypothetical protein E8F11_24205 [Pseudomonas sp. BN417]|uniref:polysaccharide pyruvyl transferase family protein n=1 Tax=Pseudomonas sp. BN417 TaxID=2567890 RepID=UPI0024542FAF|nr:polysaccharide pyruvyl transferase family protein [Pseudomonas sp. BN417]MDH4558235.1 hypothetical protein [Pseudomonas sp. BN417]